MEMTKQTEKNVVEENKVNDNSSKSNVSEKKAENSESNSLETGILTGDETIGEVIAKYPQLTNVFLKYGLHCVGCHVSYWETLEQGAKGHGMTDEVFQELLAESNKAISSSLNEFKDDNPVHISKFAVEKVKELMEKNSTEGFLRILVASGGCSGSSYEFSIDQKETDKDVSFEKLGLKVVIDKESLEVLKGANVDYVESFQGSGFKVDNPNAKSSCGCGNSFS